MAIEDENVTFEKIQNGFIINHQWVNREDDVNEFVVEKNFFKTAKETSEKLSEINKKILNKL